MFWGPGHQRPSFDGFIYIHYAAPPYSARISAIYFPPFGKVWLGAVYRVQRLTTKQNAKISGPILTRLWTKVHEIFRRCRKPFVHSNALARLSMSRFIQKIFAVKPRSRRKPNKYKSFLAPIFWEGRRRFFYGRSC